MGKKIVACFFSFTLLVILLHTFSVSLAHRVTNITTDKEALLALKAHIIVDPNSLLIANWTNTASVCNWVGITCSPRHGRVTALNLSHMNLTGTVPPRLGNLSFLTFISFGSNSFHGSLPNELAMLRRMKSFIFYNNYFIGEIPSWIGSFTRLEKLDLSYNKFTGFMPPSLFNLSRLNYFRLSYNSLQGHIPEAIGHLHSLRVLALDNNRFSGSIPSGIFNISSLQAIDLSDNGLSGSMPFLDNNMPSVWALDLGRNNLTGLLPPKLFTCFPNLEVLVLSENLFIGPIPLSLFTCWRLEVLSLSYNHFQGSIHKDIGNLTMLQVVYLNENNFSGTKIPTSIGNLVNLEKFALERSYLVGPIPSTIGNLTRLKILFFGDNSLTGTIPYEMGELPDLETVSLGVNRLSGPVPSGIYNASALTTLSLTDNNLSGNLPSSLGLNLLNLENLLLGTNNFTGPIPISLSNASMLVKIDLASNAFVGLIADELANLRNLQTLNLGENHLTTKSLSSGLSIISSLAKCKDLRYLSLAINPLNGTLPISFGNLSLSLERFEAFDCGIKGTIPKEIGNLSSLTALVLEENYLRGTIPATVAKLKKLQALSLQNNKLEGFLPFKICDLQSLGYLYLGANELFGPIPSCLGNVNSLRVLRLEINGFSSTIPSSLWKLEDILTINLSSNSLKGSISLDIGNLKAVTSIDLSMNQLSGNIPPIFGSLKTLSSISLANNRLEGSIPPSFGDAVNLQFLDLSNNSLFGEIPKSLEKLTYLTYLNVSFNKLQGQIPNEGPFAKLSAESFMGNKGLCGVAKFQVQPCKIDTTHRKLALRNVLLAVGLTVLVLAAIASIFIIMFHKPNVRLTSTSQGQLSPLATLKRISYLELEQSTNKFDEVNLLGRGSFGSVYKGILSDGMPVAIKVFNLQTAEALKCFNVECEVMRMIRHRNIVKIITSCCNIDFKALVLRFMPNYSLERWLYSHNHFLDFLQRLNIMLDVASALEYLHHGYTTSIVHCDLKPSNILLDDDMVAHVSDFGIAKLLGDEQSVIQTVSMASVGYMAPEYGSEGVVSIKGDMYSYGILLMEIFTRKKPTDEMFDAEMNMKLWVKKSLPTGVTQIIDTNLLRNKDHHYSVMDCVSSIMQLALQCSADVPQERLCIKDALNTLNKIKDDFVKCTNHAA